MIARDLVIENCKIADGSCLNRSFAFGSGFRLKAPARLRLAYAFKPPQLGFFGNPGDFGNFLYLLWLLGV
jgi:hypothetical protein